MLSSTRQYFNGWQFIGDGRVSNVVRYAMMASALIAFISVLPSTQAQTVVKPKKVVEEKLPTAKEIIEKHLKSLGGREKLAAIKTMSVTGTIEVPQVNIKGQMTMQLTGEGKGLAVVDLGPVGVQKSGSDGKTYWADTPAGAEVLTGEKAEQAKMQLTIQPLLQAEKIYDSMECTALEDFEGESCYKVVCKKGKEPATTYFFSKATGLEKGSQSTVKTPVGDMDVTSVRSDYREVQGMKFSHKTVVSLPNNMTQEFTLEKMEVDKPIPEETFALPEQIKKKLK